MKEDGRMVVRLEQYRPDPNNRYIAFLRAYDRFFYWLRSVIGVPGARILRFPVTENVEAA